MNKHLVFWLALSIIFFSLFNSAITSIATVYILNDLGSSIATSPYATVFLALGNLLTVPLARGLQRQVGIPRLFLICQTFFIITTLLAACSSTYPLFILYRFLQGLSSGPLFLILSTYINPISHELKKRPALDYILLLFITTPVLGGAWGGWLAYDFNWRYIFIINTICMIPIAILLALQFRHDKAPLEKCPFDYVGYATFFIGFFALFFFLTLGQELDWFRSPLITLNACLAIIFLPFFCMWCHYHPDPIFELRLLKKPANAFTLISITFLFATYLGMVMLLAIWLTFYVHYTVIWISTVFGMMLISMLAMNLVMKHYLDTHRVWWPLLFSIICLAFSCFYTANFNEEVDLYRIAISRILAGIAFALFLPALLHMLTDGLSAKELPKELSFFQPARLIGSALGPTIFYTMWIRRQVFYYERLGGELTLFSPITRNFFTRARRFGLHESQIPPQLDDYLSRQASSLALSDCFYFMGWLTIVLLLFTIASYFKRDALFPATKNFVPGMQDAR